MEFIDNSSVGDDSDYPQRDTAFVLPPTTAGRSVTHCGLKERRLKPSYTPIDRPSHAQLVGLFQFAGIYLELARALRVGHFLMHRRYNLERK